MEKIKAKYVTTACLSLILCLICVTAGFFQWVFFMPAASFYSVCVD